MSDRAAKLRKLNDWRRRLPHCTASALGAVLKEIQKNGLPEGCDLSRNAIRHARDEVAATQTPHGTLLQTITVFDKDENEVEVTIAHPLAMLWQATKDCSSFTVFFLARLKKHPPSPEQPWTLVIYTDEVTPGNPLATLNNRKFHALYWSFLEFGVQALCREECWFCACTEYSILVAPLSAGLSQLVASVLTKFFSDGVNLATTGMLLPFEKQNIRLNIAD